MLFVFHVCHAVLSVPCSCVVTCWERANLLALLYVVFSCVFVTFPHGVITVIGQVFLIVLIPDLCLHSYFLYFWTFDIIVKPQLLVIFKLLFLKQKMQLIVVNC